MNLRLRLMTKLKHFVQAMTSFRQILILKSWIISIRKVSYSPLADALVSFLNVGYFSDSWSGGFIVPVLQKNETKNVNN